MVMNHFGRIVDNWEITPIRNSQTPTAYPLTQVATATFAQDDSTL